MSDFKKGDWFINKLDNTVSGRVISFDSDKKILLVTFDIQRRDMKYNSGDVYIREDEFLKYFEKSV